MKRSIRKLFVKLFWCSRRTHVKFSFLNIIINKREKWGIEFLKINSNYRNYSLFSLIFLLPNLTTRKKIYVLHFDLLFFNTFLKRRWDLITDKDLFQNLSFLENLELKMYNKFFKL